MTRRRPSRRAWVVGVTGLLLLAAVVTMGRWFLWPAIDDPTSADAVVVFAGGIDGDRLDVAIELMDRDVAPLLVISTGNGDWARSEALDRLCDVGSPDFAVICIRPQPDSTIGEAVAFAHVGAERELDEIVVVSSNWHLHRAQRWLDRCFDGNTQVVGAATPRGLSDITHEMAGTLHAMVLDRSCPESTRDPVVSEFEPWPEGDAGPEAEVGTEPIATTAERRDRDPSLTECQDWVGRRFVMTVYSVPVAHPTTRTVADLFAEGFTHVGPWYQDDRWESAAAAAELGMCTVFPVGTSTEIGTALADVDAAVAAVRGDIERALADPALNESISMWSILPEEINIYRPGHLELFEALAAEVEASDPLGRPTFSYLQSNADERQFEVASLNVGVLGQGNYLSTNGLADMRGYLRASIERSLAARSAMNQPGDAVMPVLEHRIHNGTLDPEQSVLIEDWVRHDVFTSVVAGADGFIAFSGFPPDLGLDDFARYNDAYTLVVAEVIEAGLLDLYREGTVDSEIVATVTQGPRELEIPVLFVPQRDNPVEIFPSVTVRAWVDGDEHVVLVVNHANEPVSVEVSGSGLSAGDISLDPLGVRIVRL